MEPFLIFKGINTLDLGIEMKEAISKSPAPPRYENITIPGRSGTLTVWDGKAYDVVSAIADFTVKDLSRVDDICSLFSGSGDLISSAEFDKRYIARVKTPSNFSRIIRQWHSFSVEFELQPFAYESNPQTATFTEAGTIYNTGTYEAQPTIKVYGSGNATVTVNGKSFTVQGISASAIIDCENMMAYEGQTLLVTAGEFPVFPIGKNTISFSGATKVEITPNLRWL